MQNDLTKELSTNFIEYAVAVKGGSHGKTD